VRVAAGYGESVADQHAKRSPATRLVKLGVPIGFLLASVILLLIFDRQGVRSVDPYLPEYLILIFGFGGVGVLLGFIFGWWGLLASVGVACFFAYAWEFQGEGLFYALIIGMVSSVAIVAGSLVRRRVRS
jgi:hypothetical protein